MPQVFQDRLAELATKIVFKGRRQAFQLSIQRGNFRAYELSQIQDLGGLLFDHVIGEPAKRSGIHQLARHRLKTIRRWTVGRRDGHQQPVVPHRGQSSLRLTKFQGWHAEIALSRFELRWRHLADHRTTRSRTSFV